MTSKRAELRRATSEDAAAIRLLGCYRASAMPCRPSFVAGVAAFAVACAPDDVTIHVGIPAGSGVPQPPLEPPPLHLGFDAYRNWADLPTVRIGTRTYMRSTYDRTGGNEGADASHFLREEAPDFSVVLDLQGPGVVDFVRTNRWHGSPWHYVVDGHDHIVSESTTDDPTRPVVGSTFVPGDAFPSPLALTWSTTRGADLSWVPVPFERTFSLAYSRTHYGTGYYIYHLYPEGSEDLAAPLASFDGAAPPRDVLDLLRRAGDDIAPSGIGVDARAGTLALPAGARVSVTSLEGARTIRALKFRVPRSEALAASRARLRIVWDGRAEPSVDAPLALFFGAGSLYNRESTEWLVRALLTTIRFTADQVELAAYFPMPFSSSARVELAGGAGAVSKIDWEVRSVSNDAAPEATGYFHATYRDLTPVAGQDLVLLDTTRDEGGGEYCGHFVGMSWIFSDRAVLTTLEGDPRFFFDDSGSPQAQGTGTEELGGGGDYWGGRTMTLPLAGHPVGAPDAASAREPEDAIESAYRFFVADSMPFGKNARIQLEHGGTNESLEHYRSVAYWYGRPGACLELTDTLHVSDVEDEQRHGYVSPAASPPTELSSRYEWGVDRQGLLETFPETNDVGRRTSGTTEFTARLRTDNLGVLLRRKLDYGLADQRAEVYVADAVEGAPFERAGTWFLAGSNSCVYSNPPGELDSPMPVLETSNRRFRDDEFLVPRRLTQGRSAIRLRIVNTSAPHPLLPGMPPPDSGWSEFRYSVYSWVLRPRDARSGG